MQSGDRDPNEGSTDPMIQEFWSLGEEIQDKIMREGYEADSVEGIAVDIHDVLQAATRIREELGPRILSAEGAGFTAAMRELRAEFDHLRWHGVAGRDFLDRALHVFAPDQEQPI